MKLETRLYSGDLVNKEKKTIRQHMETARKYGMELASIHSAHENEIIKQLLVLQNTKDNCWIGAKRKAGAFTWMDDSNWEFENWESARNRLDSFDFCRKFVSKPSLFHGRFVRPMDAAAHVHSK